MEQKEKTEEKKQEPEKKKEPKKECSELKETLQRVQADFENYRKRIEKERQNDSRTAAAAIAKSLIPVLDNFEAALKNSSEKSEFASGIMMIYEQLRDELGKTGLKRMQSEGKKFDPYLHEALMQEESDKEKGIVIEEFQPGYTFGDIVLRHAKVKISSGKEYDNNKGNTSQDS